ncbi:flagellar hook capping protein [Pengzhenrongella sicca]|uniref:Flagellar hook capping protein n=2 Tax=Pengzhenrongella sicca TaxID=2819238 RepID=A0A8A4ZJY0_9MICO|nr:flagellar hook capping protein [Pengzhenrongella sicca]
MYTGTAAAKDTASNTLDKQAFLELLVTQLRNQDPSSPMDSNTLMAQTTQMASMESLTEISTTSREAFALQMRASAAALVGQSVSYSNGTETITGIATSVSYAASVPTVTVGGKAVPLDSISTVSTTATTTP